LDKQTLFSIENCLAADYGSFALIDNDHSMTDEAFDLFAEEGVLVGLLEPLLKSSISR